MITQPAWKFLESFDHGSAPPLAEPPPASPPPSKVAPPSAEQLDEAYNRGVQAGVAEGWAMRESEFAQALAQAEVRIERAKLDAADTLIDRMQASLQREMEALHDQIACRMMDLLTPVIRRLLTDQMLEALIAEARTLALGKHGISMEISVPSELVERLSAGLARTGSSGDSSGDVRISVADGPEITLRWDDTVIETRIGAWMALVEEAVSDVSR